MIDCLFYPDGGLPIFRPLMTAFEEFFLNHLDDKFYKKTLKRLICSAFGKLMAKKVDKEYVQIRTPRQLKEAIENEGNDTIDIHALNDSMIEVSRQCDESSNECTETNLPIAAYVLSYGRKILNNLKDELLGWYIEKYLLPLIDF